MGGTSTQQQTQNSTTNPWEPAKPLLQGILGQVQGQLGNTGATGAETGAINSIENNAANAPNYTRGLNANVAGLINGGGALNQAGNINQNYKNYYNAMNPLASNTNYDPMQTPGIGNQLQNLTDQITQNVNGSFAAAGRDGSGYNQKALGQGLTAGLAPVLTNQYNQNIQNQQGAANNLFAGGNNAYGLLSGLQQQAVANQQLAPQAAQDAMTAQNANQNAILQAEAARRGIPTQALGLLAQIGIPIAGLGGQSTGQSNGSSTMSGAQQFGLLTGGFKNLFPGGL
jgi:hypothetical protein